MARKPRDLRASTAIPMVPRLYDYKIELFDSKRRVESLCAAISAAWDLNASGAEPIAWALSGESPRGGVMATGRSVSPSLSNVDVIEAVGEAPGTDICISVDRRFDESNSVPVMVATVKDGNPGVRLLNRTKVSDDFGALAELVRSTVIPSETGE